ncbi:bublin coiled-coil protein isoform X1 [Siphateles boraxobius]|uniref:bublin coiled-coil protein isoform X1 n=1 Tax=Siphateles boraxobius TaxID=180520 RepID=UPI004064BE21
MSGPNGDPDISADDGIIEDEDEFSEEAIRTADGTVCFSGSEFAAIDSMLDQISSCLDDIEEKNDSLNGKLHELLESNRQARRDFRERLNEEEQSRPHPPEEEDPARDTQTPH